MKRLFRVAVAAAALFAAGPSHAYLRTTTCQTGLPIGVQEPGAAFWWAGSPPIVTWRLWTGHVPPGCQDLTTLQALTVASYDAWSQVPGSGFAFAFDNLPASTNGIGDDGQNIVVWRKGLCNDVRFVPASEACHPDGCGARYNCWEEDTVTQGNPAPGSVLAFTWVSFNVSTGEIRDADIELNDWNGYASSPAGFSYTCAPAGAPVCTFTCARPPSDICNCSGGDADGGGCSTAGTSCTWADVGSIVTHEAGHVLGLDHPCESCSTTMAAFISLGTSTKRELSQDDIDGLAHIYPAGSEPAFRETFGVCSTPSSPSARSTKSCGCGGDPSVALWALLGPLLLLRKGRSPRSHPHRSSLS